MIVICDFLILSIISLAKIDSPEPDVKPALEAAQAKSFADSQMLDMLKISLEKEKERREELGSDVRKLAAAAKESARQSERHKKVIEARESELRRLVKTKDSLEREREEILKKSRELEARVEQGDSRNRDLQMEILAASAKLEKSSEERAKLEREIGNLKTVDSVSRIKLENAQAELKKNKEKLEGLQAEREKLLAEKNVIELEKQALSTQLEVATTKTAIYEENLKRTQAMVDIEKTEKAQILEHAETLAAGVGDLSRDVKASRPKTPSEIFSQIKGKFVSVVFDFEKLGILSSTKSSSEVRALPVLFGSRVLLVFSASSTPLKPTFNSYFEPEKLSVRVLANGMDFYPDKVFCLKEDPRLLAVELSADFVKKSGISPLSISKNPYSFPNCVVIDPSNFRYGQAPFRADFNSLGYARLDVGLITSIFSEFSPSESDSVMTQSGDWFGIMADSTLAIVVKDASVDRALPVGSEYVPSECKAFVIYNSARLRSIPTRLR